ncbi:helix-turn-helix domain-containing protein [Corynebacterium variabile]|uniref:helix-turn-helix domain-containing protein n=1 Tax=Corynebacterium variabile TaxID=1727 RepID=UPI003FD0964D
MSEQKYSNNPWDDGRFKVSPLQRDLWTARLIQSGVSNSAIAVGVTYALYINGSTGVAWVSYDTLAENMGVSVSKVRRGVAELKKAGLLYEVRKGTNHGVNRAPVRTLAVRGLPVSVALKSVPRTALFPGSVSVGGDSGCSTGEHPKVESGCSNTDGSGVQKRDVRVFKNEQSGCSTSEHLTTEGTTDLTTEGTTEVVAEGGTVTVDAHEDFSGEGYDDYLLSLVQLPDVPESPY